MKKDNEPKFDIERAWKDEEYRKSLTQEQLAHLPPGPAGEIELDEEDLGEVSGGVNNRLPRFTWTCYTTTTR